MRKIGRRVGRGNSQTQPVYRLITVHRSEGLFLVTITNICTIFDMDNPSLWNNKPATYLSTHTIMYFKASEQIAVHVLSNLRHLLIIFLFFLKVNV